MKAPKMKQGITTAAPRGVTSRELLELRWNYPVHQVAAAPESEHGTSVEARREALPLEKAIEVLSGEDPRPLLVLRECKVCNKTDDALLSRTESNERTLVLARFFRCVKLPVDVVEPDHPFHALFPSNDSEHLFVALPGGVAKKPLESDTSRVELWSAMETTLAASYGFEANKVVKQVLALLDRVDEHERKLTGLETRKGQLMETPKVDVERVKKLDAEIVVAKADVEAARAEVAKLYKTLPTGAAAGAAR
jgi:hypothetical protein